MRSTRNGMAARTRCFEDLRDRTGQAQQHVAGTVVAPASRAAVRMRGISSSPKPGMMGATFTPTAIPASARARIVRNRRAGVAT